MDGIAVRSRDTLGASDAKPVTLTEFARVNTGNIIPPEFDAVIMIEDTWESGGEFQIRKSAAPWQHVRPAGEDVKENKLVLPRGHIIRAFDIGALATYGITDIDVLAVRVGIIPTGSELVPLGVRPGPGQVVESNTVMAQVFLSQMGAHCTRYPIVPDDPDLIREALRQCRQRERSCPDLCGLFCRHPRLYRECDPIAGRPDLPWSGSQTRQTGHAGER